MKLFIFSITAALSLSALTAAADSAIRDLVLQDCDKASASFDTLETNAHQDFALYLKNVLNLQFIEPTDPRTISSVTSVSPISGGMADPSTLARALGAERENKAKVCASRLLAKLGPLGVIALPDLLQTSVDPLASGELREASEEAAIAIAATMQDSAAQSMLSLVIPLLKNAPDGPAHNVVLYLPASASIKALVLDEQSEQGSRLNSSTQTKLLSWIYTGDGTLDRIVADKLNLASSCEPALEIAKSLECPSSLLVDAILKAAGPDSFCKLQALAALEVLSQRIQDAPQWCASTAGFMSGGDLYAQLAKLASDSLDRGDTATTLALLSAIGKLLPGRNFEPIQDLTLRALGLPCPQCPFEHPALVLMEIAARQSDKVIFSALRSNELILHQRALQALPYLAESTFRNLSPCIDLIVDSRTGVRRACAQALLPFAKAASSDLSRLVKRKMLSNARDYTALLLATVDESDKFAREILERLIPSWNCDNLVNLAPLSGSETFSANIEGRLTQCLQTNASAPLELLQLASKLPKISPGLDSQLRASIASAASEPAKLVALLSLLPREAQLNYREALGEIASSPSTSQCQALRLFWSLCDDNKQRSDFLLQRAAAVSPCLSETELPEMGSLLLALLDKSSPRDRKVFVRAIGYASRNDSALINMLTADVTADALEQRYEAIVGLLRSESRLDQLDVQLRRLLRSRLNWRLAEEKLPESAYLLFEKIANDSSDILERRAARLVLLGRDRAK